MHFLAGDLTTEGSFDLLNIFHLLHEFVKQFSGKSMWLEELLDHLFIWLKDRVPHGQDVALIAFPILAVDHLEEVVLYLLKHPFSKCQEHWQAIFSAADHSQILVEVAKWMPECSRVATRAVQVLYLFLKSNDKQADFPHLLLALLQQISARLEENRGVIESLETLHLLLRTVDIEEESLREYLDHFGRPEGFSHGLSILVRKEDPSVPHSARVTDTPTELEEGILIISPSHSLIPPKSKLCTPGPLSLASLTLI
ncbi:uncharacterized protein LOC128321989 isoform X1 [Hemicordylus capensis]|uniref:uncharacterized protein LOC128321989 isoform X1 n=1 Tax=Hemicordylus capensis TaxID=884348 RepID=UPI002302ADF4|nr:uncharacterized protein LOC128321989 isoform X1 [Hemicordylus capensis]XP_053098617.1 uncharacterized protein LOC128321989 isoform X1 [Hemicordylus capensis]